MPSTHCSTITFLGLVLVLAPAGFLAAAPSALPSPDSQGRIPLDGDDWTLQSAATIKQPGEEISQPAFIAKDWHEAEVPGTVLANYVRDKLVPDPNFGDQIKQIPEETFQNDFWYRKQFLAPTLPLHQHLFLNVDGINWKADVYLNGASIGHIDGAFQRGSFDITSKMLPEKPNVVAFLIHKCANPGDKSFQGGKRYHNGGVLGKDSPTFVASIGWNWMLPIPGRNIGIWDHVSLQQAGPVQMLAPFVHTTVAPDRQSADLTVEVTATNLEQTPQDATVTGTLGAISFSKKISLAASESKRLTFAPADMPQLHIEHPQLWWPNNYGDQPLQQLMLSLETANGSKSQQQVTFGIRQFTYDTSDNVLKISCNGQRIQLNGGNWGMDETLLRYKGADYDTAVHLHQQMHMTMIRNWVGQVGKEEFLDACDKYGLLVWNDFWLANPADGNNPDDQAMFTANVLDRITRIRNHASLALYCGRNEGDPPKALDAAMATAATSLDGTRYYIKNSASGLVSGHGPYEPKPADYYFKSRGKTLHSELGIVCVPTADSMRLMMPEKDLWPISDMWYVHDFYQPRCRIYTKRVDSAYGPSNSLDEFCEKAQMLNWETAKAMMEAWRSNSGSGGLIWMSHPAWPSLICQLYDFYLNPTAAYFGVRSGNEPMHILWDAATDEVKVANNTGVDAKHLHAQAWIYNMDGSEQSHQEADVNSGADGIATTCFTIKFPATLSPVHFIKLRLTDGTRMLSENFYWRGIKSDDYLKLNDMEKVQLSCSCTEQDSHGQSTLNIELENPTSHVALMVAAKVVKSSAPEHRILPIYYDSNYVTLLPHEKCEIHAVFDTGLLASDRPRVVIQGWNASAASIVP